MVTCGRVFLIFSFNIMLLCWGYDWLSRLILLSLSENVVFCETNLKLSIDLALCSIITDYFQPGNNIF